MRVVRAAIYLIASLIALLVLVLLLVFNLDFGRFKPQLESFAAEVLGRSFAIAGPLHFTVDLNGGVELSAQELRLAAPAWSAAPELASLRSLEVKANLWSLLGDWDPAVIESLKADGLRLYLQRDDEGRNTWTLFGDSQTPQSNGAEKERFRMPAWVSHVMITDTNIVFDSPAQIQPLNLDIKMLSENALPDGQVQFALQGNIDDESMAVQLGWASVDSLIDLVDMELSFAGHLGEIEFDGDLAIADVLNPRRPSARINLFGPNIEHLFDALQLQQVTSGPLNITLGIAPQNESMGLALDGKVGEFLVTANGSFSDLQQLEAFDLKLTASGPDAGLITGMFDSKLLPHDPFTLSGTVARAGSDITIDAVTLRVNKAQLVVDGRLEDFPDPNGAQVTAQLDIPDITRFSRLAGVPGTLDGPLHLEATAKAVPGGGGALVDATAYTRDMNMHIDGNISDAIDFVGSKMEIAFAGETLQTPLRAFNLESESATPFNLRFAVERVGGGMVIKNGYGTAGDESFALRGMVSDQPLQTDTELEFEVSSADLKAALARYGIEIQQLPPGALAAQGVLRGQGTAVGLHDTTVKFAGVTANINGRVENSPGLNGTAINLQLSGEDLAGLLPPNDNLAGLAKPFTLDAAIRLEDDTLSIEDASFLIDQTGLRLEGRLGLKPLMGQGSFKLHGNSSDVLLLHATLAELTARKRLPLKLDASIGWNKNQWSVGGLNLKLGESRVTANGTLAGAPDFNQTDLEIDMNIPSLESLSKIAGRELPDLPATLNAHLVGSTDEIKLQTFAVQLGGSDIRGEFSLRDSAVPRVVASFYSNHLDITPFLPPPGKQPPAASSQDTQSPDGGKHQRVIPDTVVPLDLFKKLDAKITVDIKELKLRAHTLQNVALQGSTEAGVLNIDRLSLKTPRGGDLEAMLALRPSIRGVKFILRAKGETLSIGLPADTTQELQELPTYALNLALISEGKTLRELAGGANGYLRIVSGPGRMKDTGLRVLTNDFIAQLVEAVDPFAVTDPVADIRCATVLVAAEQGQIIGDPVFVLQTDRVNIFSNTKIDLKTEKLKAHFHTVPQKGLGISMANLINPFVMVTGNLAQPVLSLDAEETVVRGTVAAATFGISILARGIKDRFLSPKDPCGHSLIEGDEGLRRLEEKYGEKTAR